MAASPGDHTLGRRTPRGTLTTTTRRTLRRVLGGSEDGYARRVRMVAAVLVVAAGLTATFGMLRWGHQEQARKEVAALTEDGLLLLEAAASISDRLDSRMQAVVGLFGASEDVTEEEFEGFAEDIGLLEGMGGYGFAVIVPDPEYARWLDQTTRERPSYRSFGVDAAGNQTGDGLGSVHVPILYFAPPEAFGVPPHGLDLMSDPVRADALERSLQSGSTEVTAFLHLLGEDDDDGVVAFHPVRDPFGATLGFITAPFDLSELVESTLPQSLSRRLDWRVTDLTEGQTVGALDPDADHVWLGSAVFGSRVWQIEIAHRGNLQGRSLISRPWITVPVGAAASLLAGLMVLLIAGMLDTRRRQLRLEAVIQAKDRFLASVSHRLRTPLTGVIGFLNQALVLEDDSPEERWAMVSVAADQAEAMAAIVEDLITATRSDPAALNLEPGSIDVARVIDQTVASFPGGIEVRWEPGAPARVWADPSRVRQILRNLLANAVEYGRPPVDVIVVPDGPVTRIRIADHGTGIPTDELPHLFQPHNPFNQSASQPEALGIGLWVSRHLARLMGGDLTYDRHPVPTFTLTLPAVSDAWTAVTRRPVAASIR